VTNCSGMLRAGIAERSITPPVGVDLCGYAARPGPSLGAYDDLWCRALVLDDGGSRVALVALDLLETSLALDEKLREAAAAAAGLSADRVLINASHTHAGPVALDPGGLGDTDAGYVSSLPARVAETVAAAADALAPAAVAYGTAPVRVGINRRQRTDSGVVIGRNPEGLVDNEVRVLRIDAGGAPIAVFQHACHGTTLGGDNRLITAEWMGRACAQLARGNGWRGIFLQGCAGQTNPNATARTYGEVERLGGVMAEAVTAAAARAEPIACTPLAGAYRQIGLPLEDPPDPATARADLDRALADAARARQQGAHPYWVRALESLVRHQRRVLTLSERGATGLTLPFAVQALAMGDLAIVGLSGEVFLEFAHHIAAASPFPHTWALGYTGGCQCYVPTAEAFAEGGYEAQSSFGWYGTLPLRPHAGDEMTAAAGRLLQGVRSAP
jgi:neutral ceramidase